MITVYSYMTEQLFKVKLEYGIIILKFKLDIGLSNNLLINDEYVLLNIFWSTLFGH